MTHKTKARKDTFLLHTRHATAFTFLDDEQKARLLEAIFQYNIDGDLSLGKLNDTRSAIFAYMRDDIDNNNAAYEKKLVRCKEAGKKGGRPKREEGE